MNLLLKIVIVCSILLMYVGLHSEELIARYFSGYERYNREAVVKAYEAANLSDAQALIQAQRLDLDSREFYSRVSAVAKEMVWWSSVLFYSSLGLLLKGDIEDIITKLISRRRRPARSSAKSSHN